MIITRKLRKQSKGSNDMLDLTPEVEHILELTELDAGTVTVFVTGSTAGITTMEYEPGLVADFKEAWERLVPRDLEYKHNQAWGDDNGYSHIRASILGASITVPFADKKLSLGRWQQIVLVDFDNRPRAREVVVQVMGD